MRAKELRKLLISCASGAPFNFVEFRPRKTTVNFDLKLEKKGVVR